MEEVSLRSRLKLQAHIRDHQTHNKATNKQFLSHVPKVLEKLGITTDLRNATYTANDTATSTLPPHHSSHKSSLHRQTVLNHGTTPCNDELDCIQRARRQWEEGICEEVNALAEEQGRPLARLRTSATIANDEKRRESMSAVEQQATRRFLFDGEDLLEAILQIEVANRNRHASSSYVWGVIKIMFKTPTLSELRHIFHELSPAYRQTGIDETMYTGGDTWADRRLRLGNKICAAGYVGVMRGYAKRGIPPSLRPEMWRKLLGMLNTFDHTVRPVCTIGTY